MQELPYNPMLDRLFERAPGTDGQTYRRVIHYIAKGNDVVTHPKGNHITTLSSPEKAQKAADIRNGILWMLHPTDGWEFDPETPLKDRTPESR